MTLDVAANERDIRNEIHLEDVILAFGSEHGYVMICVWISIDRPVTVDHLGLASVAERFTENSG